MGIFHKIAESIESQPKKKISEFGKLRHLSVPYRTQGPRFPDDTNRYELEGVLENLVDKKLVAPETINEELEVIRRDAKGQTGSSLTETVNKNKSKSPQRYRLPDDTNMNELKEVLNRLVNTGEIAPEIINNELEMIRRGTMEKTDSVIMETEYHDYIDEMDVSDEIKEKLSVMANDYEEAVATAREFDRNIQVPPRGQVMAAILKLGDEQLEKIATILKNPGLVITPANQSFGKMKNNMHKDKNRHFKGQKGMYLGGSYNWSGRKEKVGVFIVDMAQYTDTVSGQLPKEQTNLKQLAACERFFRENGMDLVHDYVYLAAVQRAMRLYKKAIEDGEPDPGKYILDYYRHGESTSTVTMLNGKQNYQDNVSVGRFRPELRQIQVLDYYFQYCYFDLRGRAEKQII